ncbi:MAG: lysozyme inhibitor LprI family protein [Cetobacterium sp.]
MKKLLFIFLTLSLTLSAGVRKEYQNKIDIIQYEYEMKLENDPSTRGMVEAAEYKYKELDNMLNYYYNEFKETLSESQRNLLKNSQKDWLKFRDKEVEFAREFYGNKDGTVWRIYPGLIKVELLERRLSDFINHLEDQFEPEN